MEEEDGAAEGSTWFRLAAGTIENEDEDEDEEEDEEEDEDEDDDDDAADAGIVA